MKIVAIISLIFVALVSRIYEKNFHNPAFIMSFLWAIIVVLASLHLYSLNEASSLTYVLITIGILAFGIGCLISSHVSLKLNGGNISHISSSVKYVYEETIDYRAIRFLCVMSVLLLIYPTIMVVNNMLVFDYNMSIIRTEGIATYNNVVLNLIYNYIVRPFSFAIIPIFAIELFLSKRKDKYIIICTILIIAARVLTEGGRFVILYVLCNLWIVWRLSKKRVQIKRKTKRRLFIIAVVCVYAIYVVSSSRGITDLWQSLYIYLCGCIPHLSIRLETIVSSGQYTFGLASLNGFFMFIFAMLDNVGLAYPDFYVQAQQLMYVENPVVIDSSGGLKFNAFVGPFFYMFLDFRYLGVFMGMLLYGVVSYHFYKGANKYLRYRNIAVYALIAQGIITSMVRIQFANMYYALAFIFLYILIRKVKILEKNDSFKNE